MATPDHSDQSPTLDAQEVARFDALAAQWWDAGGKFAPLHRLNPTRLAYIRDALCTHFGRDGRGRAPLQGLAVADIGCGGGLLAEPLTRLGASLTGVDPGADTIAAARRHAKEQGLAIDYRVGQAEDLAREGRQFDAVLALEVVEHVPDVAAFIATCAALVRPGGLLVLSTINRTLKSFALAIVGAEYVLRWLPVGTHQWNRFVTPDELATACARTGLTFGRLQGVIYHPLRDAWLLSEDTDVNYMATAARPA